MFACCDHCGKWAFNSPRDYCDYCDDGILQPRLEGEEILGLAEAISKRIDQVCTALDYDCNYFDIDGGEVEVYWSGPACTRGCCGWESGTESFPLSYLLLNEDELKKTEEGRKLEEERKRKEREAAAREKRELENARRRLQQAQAKARTAEQDAAKELKEAQRKLQSLEGMAT